MIDRDEVIRNIRLLLQDYADNRTEIEIIVRNDREADVYLDGNKFNTYLVDEKCFLHNISDEMKRQGAFSISITISRNDLKDRFRMYKGAELQLPATANEIKDAFQRARITGKGQDYSILRCVMYEEDILTKCQEKALELKKLNYLAKVMSRFSNHEHELFKGIMKTIKNEEFSINKLINGAYNLDGCFIIDGVKNDEQLGKIYADNGWIDWLEGVDKRIWRYMNYEALGRDIREADNGIYTDDGYFVKSKGTQNVVYNGKSFPESFAEDRYIFKLQIANKGKVDDEETIIQDWLTLPASQEDMSAFLQSIGAESLSDCTLIAVKSMERHIPMCIKSLSQFEMLNALALRMSDMDRKGELVKFKAMLSIANIQSLEDVHILMNEINKYKLSPEPSSVIEYAKAQFQNGYADKLPQDIIKHFNFVTYSETLPNRDWLRVTEYGMLEIPMQSDAQYIIQRGERLA